MRFLAGFVWLIEDLVNCLFPLDIPEPIEWTDDNP